MGPQQKIASPGLEDRTGSAGDLVFSGLCWPGFAFDRRRVQELEVPAYCWTPDGELWEFEEGGFYVTTRGERERRRADEADAPLDGWSHPEDCECVACRVARH